MPRQRSGATAYDIFCGTMLILAVAGVIVQALLYLTGSGA